MFSLSIVVYLIQTLLNSSLENMSRAILYNFNGFFFVVVDGSKFQKWWFLISAFFSSLFLLGSRCTYVNVIWCKIKWSFRINTTHIREKYTLVNFECFKIGVIFDICWKNAVSGFDYESLWYHLKRICKSTVVWLVIAKNNLRFLNNFK